VAGTLSSDTVDVGESIAESGLDEGIGVDLSSATEESVLHSKYKAFDIEFCVEEIMIGSSQSDHDDRRTYHGLEAVWRTDMPHSNSTTAYRAG
jgi:hypothetical protein